jgi:hypothetical protein
MSHSVTAAADVAGMTSTSEIILSLSGSLIHITSKQCHLRNWVLIYQGIERDVKKGPADLKMRADSNQVQG